MTDVTTELPAAGGGTNPRTGELLVDAGVLAPDDLATVLAGRGLGERFADAVVRLQLAAEDDELVVATDDPSDVPALDDVRMVTGVRVVRPEVAPAGALALARRRVYRDLAAVTGGVAAPVVGPASAAGGSVDPPAQDGRARVEVGGEPVDLRVSTMPTLDGEAVVLRLLPQGDARLRFDELGLDADVQRRLREALARPQGLVLVTGPTGSGKTSTLYAALIAASDPTRNVLTLEDPSSTAYRARTRHRSTPPSG